MEENTNTSTQPAPSSPPQPAKTNSSASSFFKKNKTPLLIIGLTLLTVLLVMVALSPKQTITPSSPTPKTVVNPADTTLSMTQASSSATTTGTQSVNINIDTGKNKVNAVQFELSYDPTVITNVDIVSGPFLDKTLEAYKKVDTINGRVSFDLVMPIGGSTYNGTGVAAVVSYTPLSATKPVEIKFLPKTVVTALGFSATAIKSSTDFTSTPTAQ